MPASSHINCERCHVRRTHRRAKYAMCPPCRRAHVAELHARRAEAKRKIDPVHEVIVDGILEAMSPDDLVGLWQQRTFERVPLPLPSDLMPRVRPVTDGRQTRPDRLTDEQRLEIGRRYEEGQSYDQIKRDLGVSSKTISETARALGLNMRGIGSPKQDIPAPAPAPAPEQEVPAPVAKALENMLVVPPKPEPLHSTPLLDEGLFWQIRVAGTITLSAPSIENALHLARQAYPDLHITGINQAT